MVLAARAMSLSFLEFTRVLLAVVVALHSASFEIFVGVVALVDSVLQSQLDSALDEGVIFKAAVFLVGVVVNEPPFAIALAVWELAHVYAVSQGDLDCAADELQGR